MLAYKDTMEAFNGGNSGDCIPTGKLHKEALY
jgi:hypothetical protein